MSEKINAYAEAVHTIAAAEGVESIVESELFQFAQAVNDNEELRSTLSDPRLPTALRQQIVVDILGPAVHPATSACLSLLIAAGRASQLMEIATAVSERSAQGSGQLLATVRSAVALSDAQRDQLAAALAKATGSEVSIRTIVDPSVIGGVLTQIGDEVIDGTIRSRLTQLRDAF